MIESERLARRYFTLISQDNREELLEILHPEVELVLKTTRPGDVLRGPAEIGRFLDEISERFYETVSEIFRPVDDARIVVEGRIRWVDEDRVLRDDPMIWALEFREGLLFRSMPAQTALEAESILGVAERTDLSRP
jgi:hypothetical protein